MFATQCVGVIRLILWHSDLKAEHQAAELFIGDEDAVAAMADFPVLAVREEIASAEGDGARTVPANQRRLFPEMRVRRRDFHARRGLADALLPL